MPIRRNPLTLLDAKNRKAVVWLIFLVAFLIFGVIEDLTGGKGFGGGSSNSSTSSPDSAPLAPEVQKGLDAENAMDAQNKYAAQQTNQPIPPKLRDAYGSPAKTNPDGTISVSARRLYYDYVTTGVAASEKYEHRTLKITGVLLDTDYNRNFYGSDEYWISLVSGNTWIDNDGRAKGCIGCYFTASASRPVLNRIEKIINDRAGVPMQIVVDLTCVCKCDAPNEKDPQIRLDSSSIKIKSITPE